MVGRWLVRKVSESFLAERKDPMGRESVITYEKGKLLHDVRIKSLRRIYILSLKKIVGVNIGRKHQL